MGRDTHAGGAIPGPACPDKLRLGAWEPWEKVDGRKSHRQSPARGLSRLEAVMSRVPWGRKMTAQVLLQMPLFLLGLFLVPGKFSWRCLGTSVKMPSLC